MIMKVNIRSYLPGIRQGETLEKFIDRELRSPEDFKKYMNEAVDKVVHYLHKMSSHDSYKRYSVKEVVKSGSLGKGTAIGTSADADLVVFFNGFNTMEELVRNKPRLIADIKQYMCDPECSSSWLGTFLFGYRPFWVNNIHAVKVTDYHIEFRIKIEYNGRYEYVELDVLPALDVVEKHGGNMANVYREMQEVDNVLRTHYSVCFCKKQKELFRPCNSKVKDLIRLLKYWKKYNNLDIKSYCCEVLSFYIHKTYLGDKFKMLAGFQKAMELLSNCDELCLSISPYYNTSDWQSCFPTTHLTDPANPYSNTLPWNKEPIKQCARRTLHALNNDVPDKSGWCSVM